MNSFAQWIEKEDALTASAYTLPLDVYHSNAYQQAIAHANRHPKQETCGAITVSPQGNIHFIPLDNVADDIANNFKLSNKDLRDFTKMRLHMGDRIIIVHSHLPGHLTTLSADDVYEATRSHFPYLLLYGEKFGQNEYFDAAAAAVSDYEGRPWRRYSANCFTLVRDWLLREQDFDLERAIVQQLNLRGHSVHTVSQALDSIDLQTVVSMAKDALSPVPEWEDVVNGRGGSLAAGDILIMRSDMDMPAHIGVILEPEKNEILHQTFDRVSRKDSFNKRWRNSVVDVVRPKLS